MSERADFRSTCQFDGMTRRSLSHSSRLEYSIRTEVAIAQLQIGKEKSMVLWGGGGGSTHFTFEVKTRFEAFHVCKLQTICTVISSKF